MNYILIDSVTRRPVPLPLHVNFERSPATIVSFNDKCVQVQPLDRSLRARWIESSQFGMELITEADFMKEQAHD